VPAGRGAVGFQVEIGGARRRLRSGAALKGGPSDVPEVDTAEAQRPRLVEARGGGTERPRHESRWSDRMGRSGRLSALFALLLLLSVATLVVQSHRVEKLAGEVAALELQVDAANRRLAAYQAQRSLVRNSLGSVLEELTVLHEVVSEDPLAASEPVDAP
jgi:hypothetical protein